MPEAKNKEENQNSDTTQNEGEIRIGVYTCYCGGNISDVVQCEKVAKAVGREENVVVTRTNMSMCSDAGQAMIEEDIAKHGLNRVIVGACAPSLHEQTFRGTVIRAGLNPYLYHHVGIREQDSWVHHDDPDGATNKAIRLLSAGINPLGRRKTRPGHRWWCGRFASSVGYRPSRASSNSHRKDTFPGWSHGTTRDHVSHGRISPRGAA